MIANAVQYVASQLNRFLQQSYDLNEDVVLVSDLLDDDGGSASPIHNKLVLFLVNLEREATVFQQGGHSSVGGRQVISSMPLHLNLYLMLAANFKGDNYPEALKFLSKSIEFYQQQGVFDHQNAPDLDPRIDKLTLAIENLSFHDLSSMWGSLGGAYRPSILYKVRMITFEANDVKSQVSPVSAPPPPQMHGS